MTTIATDGKSMAGDGLCCVDDMATTFDRKKVERLGDGSLLGCAGRSADIACFKRWLADGGRYPKMASFAALLLKPDGVLLYYHDGVEEPSEMNLPAATGSGREIAIGAMEAGATPVEAVEIAAKRDTGTGGEITVLHLEAVRAVAA